MHATYDGIGFRIPNNSRYPTFSSVGTVKFTGHMYTNYSKHRVCFPTVINNGANQMCRLVCTSDVCICYIIRLVFSRHESNNDDDKFKRLVMSALLD